jgi:hypothetical protein
MRDPAATIRYFSAVPEIAIIHLNFGLCPGNPRSKYSGGGMDFALLMTAAELGMKFWEVVGPSAIADALSASGDAEHDAAAKALRNIRLARQPESSVQQAIVHLQSACTAYDSAVKKIMAGTNYFIGMVDIQERTQRAALDYCLIAVCQKMIGEPELMQAALTDAAALIAANPFDIPIGKIWREKGFALGTTFIVTNLGATFVRYKRFSALQTQKISKQQFDEFCQTIGSPLAKPARKRGRQRLANKVDGSAV